MKPKYELSISFKITFVKDTIMLGGFMKGWHQNCKNRAKLEKTEVSVHILSLDSKGIINLGWIGTVIS